VKRNQQTNALVAILKIIIKFDSIVKNAGINIHKLVYKTVMHTEQLN
jgi:hypothetical protein